MNFFKKSYIILRERGLLNKRGTIMKKILFLTFIFCSLTLFAKEIGVVDADFVIQNYKKRELLETALNSKRDELVKTFTVKKENLLKKENILMEKGDSATKEELDSLALLQQDLDNVLAENDRILGELFDKYFEELRGDIAVAAILIGKEKNLDMVIQKAAAFYGGVDITEEVIDFLNSTQKIDMDKKGIKLNNDLKKI